MLDATDRSSLAHLFHLNSEPWIAPEGAVAETPPYVPSSLDGREIVDRVPLPEPDVVPGSVLEVVRRRSSCRDFAAESLALSDLGDLLAGAYGFTRNELLETGLELGLRGVPSAGALYPLELYLLLERVDGLDDGLYHYDPSVHGLDLLRADVARERLDEVFILAPLLDNANALVFISGVFERTLYKYGARGYRYVLLESAHVAQNLCLMATERGLASICVGGFRDSAANRFLGLDPRVDGVVYCVGLGRAVTRDGPEPA